MKKITVPVILNFNEEYQDQVGFLIIDNDKVKLNINHVFNPIFHFDKDGKHILKEINLVLKR